MHKEAQDWRILNPWIEHKEIVTWILELIFEKVKYKADFKGMNFFWALSSYTPKISSCTSFTFQNVKPRKNTLVSVAKRAILIFFGPKKLCSLLVNWRSKLCSVLHFGSWYLHSCYCCGTSQVCCSALVLKSHTN